jgi:spore maturation protein CgeB
MKILLLGPSCNYNLEYFTKINLERLGCEVKFCGYVSSLGRLASPVRLSITRSNLLENIIQRTLLSGYNREIRRISREFKPDVVLVIKGEALNPVVMNQVRDDVGAKIVLWYTDDPRYYNTIIKRTLSCFDFVFTVSPRAIDTYRTMGVENVQCIPVACDPSFHRKIDLGDDAKRRYDWDVVFVGTYYPRRARFVKALKRSGVRVGVYGPYWNYAWPMSGASREIAGPEMVKAFNAAKIVLNVHADTDVAYKVNTRTFEATGCRSFVLTDRTYGMAEAFDIGKELECYENEKDLVELTKYYLGSNQEREEKAFKGQERAYSDHTYSLRLTQMLSALN